MNNLRFFTEQDYYIIKECQNNMRGYDPAVCQEDRERLLTLCDIIFPKEYEKCLTRSIAGMQLMLGPIGLIYARNTFLEEVIPDDMNIHILELMHDIKATIGPKAPFPLIVDNYMRKIAITADSKPLNDTSDWSEELDSNTVRVLDYMSTPGTWDNAEIPGAYVIVSAEDYHKVSSLLKLLTFITCAA